MAEVIAERQRERERLIGVARAYVDELSKRVSVRAAAVVGSVARGDFNVWSDVDVVVVADDLPLGMMDRMTVLMAHAPGGVQPVGFVDRELTAARRRGNALVEELAHDGVVITGAAALEELLGRTWQPPSDLHRHGPR